MSQVHPTHHAWIILSSKPNSVKLFFKIRDMRIDYLLGDTNRLSVVKITNGGPGPPFY